MSNIFQLNTIAIGVSLAFANVAYFGNEPTVLVSTATLLFLFLAMSNKASSLPASPSKTATGGDERALGLVYQRQEGKVDKHGHVLLRSNPMAPNVQVERSRDMLALLNQRRSVRFFSNATFPEEVVRNAILAAGTAPSGAHCQPWHFCVVKTMDLKQRIRQVVEAEEQVNYDRRMRKAWVDDVAHLVTNLHSEDGVVHKPYLTDAPYVVVVMKQAHGIDKDGNRVENYYVEQSVGLAVGAFLGALTNAGLMTLTSTPMGAETKIREILDRPKNEKVFLLMPIGFPASDCTVPYRDEQTLRKPFEEIASFH